ncbi:MAG TPA: hypothetical protein VF167_19400 [Longimicrobiaceae bacterium]
MARSAKDIRIAPIAAKDARRIVTRLHYSGKVVNNSQLHLGVFLDGQCKGALSFGPPLDKRKVLGLVEGTGWNEMLELNRMALADDLPRNGESRALAVSMRLLRKHAPHIKWVLSFADGTQCGDGTIYRAAGFVLTGIKKNTQIWEAPTGAKFSRTSLTDGRSRGEQARATRIARTSYEKSAHILDTGGASMKKYREAGFRPLPGYQFRYIYFIDRTYRDRLTVPVIPFDKIPPEARMYRGQRLHDSASEGEESSRPATSGEEGGASPTPALQHNEA